MNTRTRLQYAAMAFIAAMVMGVQIDDAAPTAEPRRITSEPPVASRSAAPPAPSAQPAPPSPSRREQRPTAPGQEAMELRGPLARGVVQA